MSRSAAAAASAGRAASGRGSGGRGGRGSGSASTADSRIELGLDKGQCHAAVLVAVALMGGSVVSVAAVRVRCIAVRLDVAGIWALEP